MLELKNICLRYENKKAVEDVSFRIEKEDVCCLLGESGSGKTSLLRAIAGFEPLKKGEIVLRGENLNQIPSHKRGLGFVFQALNLFPHMKVLENIEIRKKCPSYLIEALELGSLLSKYPHEISGGEAQKVALCRTLNSPYDLLLLDEPFSHIDGHNKKTLASNLKTLFQKEKKTVLFVTHSEKEAFWLASFLGVMKKGRLLQWDTPKEVYHRPTHPFVAQLLGKGFFLKLREKNRCALGEFHPVVQKQENSCLESQVFIRPEQLVLGEGESMKISDRAFLGDRYLLFLETQKGERVLCYTSRDYELGGEIKVSLKKEEKAIVFVPFS